jgi:hypothetical protein
VRLLGLFYRFAALPIGLIGTLCLFDLLWLLGSFGPSACSTGMTLAFIQIRTPAYNRRSYLSMYQSRRLLLVQLPVR